MTYDDRRNYVIPADVDDDLVWLEGMDERVWARRGDHMVAELNAGLSEGAAGLYPNKAPKPCPRCQSTTCPPDCGDRSETFWAMVHGDHDALVEPGLICSPAKRCGLGGCPACTREVPGPVPAEEPVADDDPWADEARMLVACAALGLEVTQ